MIVAHPHKRWWLLALFVLGILAVGLRPATIAAQDDDRSLYWERFDVTIDILPSGDFQVTEVNEINFERGEFSFGFREIPTERTEAISNVSVTGDGQPYTERGGGTEPRTFYLYEEDGKLGIRYNFPRGGGQHTFVIRYLVQGGLRYYPDGDQLWWQAIYEDRPAYISQSSVTVNLPEAVDPDELRIATNGGGAASQVLQGGRQIVFDTGSISASEGREVRVQFPSGIVSGSAPSWQAEDDRRRQLGDTLTPIFGGIGLLLTIGALVGPYMVWFLRGRDTAVALQAEYISEPPDTLPPGLVGTLLDEKADLHDIMATILDLARRGAIRMEERKTAGSERVDDYHFTLLNPEIATTAYERLLISEFFGPYHERDLSDLKQKFYTSIPRIESQLYDEAVAAGLFPESPTSVRNRWGIAGGLLIAVAVGVGFMVGAFGLLEITGAALCLAIPFGLGGLTMMVVANAMPRKTNDGAERAAKWRAFERYLRNIDKYGDLDAKKPIWDQYLPYAIAFGIEREFLNKFAKVDAPAPSWYTPYGYHPYGYGYGGTTSGGSLGNAGGSSPTEGAWEGRGGGGGLQGASNQMATSLQSMSTGLSSMLTTASSTLTSTPPSSSSSGGGGGWSGGGSFGGGGGGGSGGFG